MKKIFSLVFILTLLVSSASFAQLAIDKGTKFLNAGIGVGGYGGLSASGGITLGASFDVGVVKNITVGALGDYHSYGDGVNSFDIGVRGSYHFNELAQLSTDKVDLYAGLGISYFNISYGGYSANSTYVPFHAGARYFFSDKIGGFAELGSSLSTLKIGVTFKF